jgi:hypothetical protein
MYMSGHWTLHLGTHNLNPLLPWQWGLDISSPIKTKHVPSEQCGAWPTEVKILDDNQHCSPRFSKNNIIDLASSHYRTVVTRQSQWVVPVCLHQALDIGNVSRCTVLAAWNDLVRFWSLSQKYVQRRHEPTRTDNKNIVASRKPGRDMQTPSTSVTETVHYRRVQYSTVPIMAQIN